MPYQPKGYTYNPKKFPSKPFHAQMSVFGKTVYLGNYATPAEATAAYLSHRKENPIMPKGKKNYAIT